MTDKAFDLAKGMTMKVSNVPLTNKRSIITEYDNHDTKRKKEEEIILSIKNEALSMGQVYFSYIISHKLFGI